MYRKQRKLTLEPVSGLGNLSTRFLSGYASYDLSEKDPFKQIHWHIFSSIYPFAGKPRITEISKGGILFLPHTLIESEAKACFDSLASENYLEGLNPRQFGARAGYYLGWINKIHPFREGNGRTQRLFLTQLARRHGYDIEWTGISGDAMARACRGSRTEDPCLEQACPTHLSSYF